MPYEIYKMIHIVMIVILFSGLTLSLFGKNDNKLMKILTGVSTLLIFVSGMGLIARIGVSHGEGWPVWLYGKMTIWLIIGAGGPIVAKRSPNFGIPFYWITIGLLTLATYLVNYKPG